jgi:hypothetical protein
LGNGILLEKLLIAIHQPITLAVHQNIGIDRFQEYIWSELRTIVKTIETDGLSGRRKER